MQMNIHKEVHRLSVCLTLNVCLLIRDMAAFSFYPFHFFFFIVPFFEIIRFQFPCVSAVGVDATIETITQGIFNVTQNRQMYTIHNSAIGGLPQFGL